MRKIQEFTLDWQHKVIWRTSNGEEVCLPTDMTGIMSIEKLLNYIQATQRHITNMNVKILQSDEDREKALKDHIMVCV